MTADTLAYLVLDVLLIDGTELDLIESHLETWADLLELDLLAALLVHVVAERDVVVDVGKGHDALALVLGHREEVLEYVGDALAERRRKVMEHQVRILLRHRAVVLNVVAHDDVGEAKVRRGAERQMRHDDAVRYAACLVQNHNVGDATSLARCHDLFDLMRAAIDALAVGEHELHLLHAERRR